MSDVDDGSASEDFGEELASTELQLLDEMAGPPAPPPAPPPPRTAKASVPPPPPAPASPSASVPPPPPVSPPPAPMSSAPPPSPRVSSAPPPGRVSSAPPPPPEPVLEAEPPGPEPEPVWIQDARGLVERCQRELGLKPEPLRAARLHHELARFYEGPLEDSARAAGHYQKAYGLANDHLGAIRGARRTLLAAGKHRAILPFFDAEVRLVGEPSERARLLYEKGRLLEDRLGQRDQALAAYRSALELAPTSASVLKAIARCQRQAEAWGGLADTEAALANAVEGDHRYKAALTARRARLIEVRLDDEAAAAQLYTTAFAVDPDVPGVLRSIKRLSLHQGRWRDLVAVLLHEYETASSPRGQAEALLRIARIQQHQLGDDAQAIVALENAVAATPDDPDTLRALARLYEGVERHDALAAVLESLLEHIEDPHARVALAHRVGQVYESRLTDLAQARRWYEVALELDPDFSPVIQALGRLYEGAQDWDATIRMHRTRASAVEEPRVRAAAHAHIADILERRLDKPDEAAAEHKKALAYLPTHEASFKALVRLHAGAGRYRDLVELYERAIDSAPDDTTAVAYLFRVGAIYEDRLGDAAGAMHAYKRVLGRRRDDLGAIQAMSRAALRGGHHEVAVEHLEREARLAKDPARSTALLYRAAEVYESHLGDATAAVLHLRRVLDRDRAHEPALLLSARLYQQLGRWDDLFSVWESQLESTASTTTRVRLLHKMGELSELHLGRPVEAIARYRATLELDADHTPSYEALRSLFRRRDAWTELAELLEQRATTRSSDRERARVLLELGRLQEAELDDKVSAVQAYERALKAEPLSRAALDARTRLLAEQGAFRQLAEALEEEAQHGPDADVVEALFRLGSVYADRLGDLRKAIDAYDQILSRQPEHLGALLALEALHQRTRSGAALAAVYRKLAEVVTDRDAELAIVRELARVENNADDPAAGHREVLRLRDDDPQALEALADAARARGDEAEWLAVEARLAAAAPDKVTAGHHQSRLAELLERAGSDEAMGAFRAALVYDPDSMVATRGFTRAAQKAGDPASLREAAKRELRVTGDEERVLSLLLSSADARRHEGDLAGAADDLERCLGLAPSRREVWSSLKSTLLTLDQIDRLLEQLGRAAHDASPQASADLHVEVAALRAERKLDVAAALAALERALVAVPGHLGAIGRRATYYERLERWAEAAEDLEDLQKRKRDPGELLELQRRLALLYDDRLDSPQRALRNLEAVCSADPDDRKALSRMGRIYARLGRKDEALAVARRLVDKTERYDAKASALVDVARIEGACGHPAEAARALLEAVALEGPEGRAAEGYRRLLVEAPEAANWDALGGALSRHVSQAERLGRPLGPTFLAIAEIYGDRMQRPDRALSALRSAVAKVPEDNELRLDLARRVLAMNGHDEVVRVLRDLIDRDVAVADAYRLLAAAHRGRGDEAEASVAALPLRVLDAGTPEELVALRARVARPASTRPGLLGDAGLREVQADGALDTAAVGLLGALADTFAKLYPGDPGRFGVSKRDRITTRGGHAVRVAADRVAMILGVPDYDLYLHHEAAVDVSLELGSTPALMVPSWAEQLGREELVYLLTRPLVLAAHDLSVLAKVPPRDLALVVTAAVRNTVPGFGDGIAPAADLDAMQREVSRAVPRRSRKAVEAAAAHFATQPVELEAWVAGMHRTAARAACLVADDIVASVAMAQRVSGSQELTSGIPADLIRLWVSDVAARFRRASAPA